MATNSVSPTVLPSFTIPISSNPKLSFFSCSLPSKVNTFKLGTAVRPSVSSSTRVFAAPEILDGTETLSPEVCFVEVTFFNACVWWLENGGKMENILGSIGNTFIIWVILSALNVL